VPKSAHGGRTSPRFAFVKPPVRQHPFLGGGNLRDHETPRLRSIRPASPAPASLRAWRTTRPGADACRSVLWRGSTRPRDLITRRRPSTGLSAAACAVTYVRLHAAGCRPGSAARTGGRSRWYPSPSRWAGHLQAAVRDAGLPGQASRLGLNAGRARGLPRSALPRPRTRPSQAGHARRCSATPEARWTRGCPSG
jgi:hypothetical protein